MDALLAAVLFLQDKTAEEIFLKIEKSITGAKTLSIRFKSESQGAGDDHRPLGEHSGVILLKDGNKARIEVDSISHDYKENLHQPWKVTIISDGKSVLTKSGPTVPDLRSKLIPAPADLKAEFSLLVSRTGWNETRFLMIANGAPNRAASDFTLLNHKLGSDGKGHVTYTLQSARLASVKTQCELLYNRETFSPVQRKMLPSAAGQPITTETYLEFTVDGNISDDRFVLPGTNEATPVSPAKIVECLRGIADAEADFRENDRDNNKMNDYWVGDVSGLYRLLVNGIEIREIEASVARADGTPLNSPELSPAPAAKPVPVDGFLLVALKQYEEKGKAIPFDNGTHRNPSRFGICAYPADYPKSEVFTWIMTEKGKKFRKDTGGKIPELFPEDPVKAGWELIP